MKALGTDYENAKASTGDFTRLPAGGYVARITEVVDTPDGDKPYLTVTYDIAEGQFKDYYADEWGKEHPYAHQFRQYYSTKALGAFKGFLFAVDKSNGTDFVTKAKTGLNEKELVGKQVGLVIAYKERMTDRGEVREVSYVDKYRSVEAIHEGRFNVPELRKLAPTASTPPAGFENIAPDDLPFF